MPIKNSMIETSIDQSKPRIFEGYYDKFGNPFSGLTSEDLMLLSKLDVIYNAQGKLVHFINPPKPPLVRHGGTKLGGGTFQETPFAPIAPISQKQSSNTTNTTGVFTPTIATTIDQAKANFIGGYYDSSGNPITGVTAEELMNLDAANALYDAQGKPTHFLNQPIQQPIQQPKPIKYKPFKFK